MSNKALTYMEQIQKLKSKGMDIKNDQKMYELLSNFNYTKVISPLKELWAKLINLDVNVEDRQYELSEIEKIIKSAFVKGNENSHIYFNTNFNDEFVFEYWNLQKNKTNKFFSKINNFEDKIKTKVAHFISILIDKLNLDQEKWIDYFYNIISDSDKERFNKYIKIHKTKKIKCFIATNTYDLKYSYFHLVRW